MQASAAGSVRSDLAFNYVATLLQALVPLLAIPVLARFLLPDVMALVLLFTTFALLLAILDGGLAATSMRQIADLRGGGLTGDAAVGRVRTIELTYVAVAVVVFFLLMALAGALASDWFVPEELSTTTLTLYLRIVFVGLVARFVGGLYRNTLIGFDLIKWVSITSIVFTIIRYGLACVAAVSLENASVVVLTVFASSYVAETAVVFAKSRRCVRGIPTAGKQSVSVRHLRAILPFALSILASAAMWAAISQMDRIVLSGQLTLAEFADFAILLTLSGAVGLLGAPVAAIVQPRLTRYLAAHDMTSARLTFIGASALVSALVCSTTVWIAFTGSEIISTYLGGESTLTQAPLILTLYAIGNSAVALSAFSYYLQYAIGVLRLHLVLGLVQLLLMVPLMVWAAVEWGALGCAIVWAVGNSLVLIGWVPYVIHRFTPGWTLSWALWTAAPLFGCAVGGLLAFTALSVLAGEPLSVLSVAVVGIASVLGAGVPLLALWRSTARTAAIVSK